MVQSESNDAPAILEALRAGRFYASTGVTIDSIRVSGNGICVSTRDAQRIVASIDYGRRVAHADAPQIAFTVPNDVERSYVRFECYGPGESMAWTQPFFILP
jgi:Iap family predicted aminopeptidase